MKSKLLRKNWLVLLMTVVMMALTMTACGPKEAAEMTGEAEESRKAADASLIDNLMNALEVTAADPEISWGSDQVFYVKLTASGAVYQCDSAEALDYVEMIMPATTMVIMSEWADGFEMWGKKNENSVITFSTSWDKEKIEEVSPGLAKRFYETSVNK